MKRKALLFIGIFMSVLFQAQAEDVFVSPGETGNLTMAVQSDGDSPIPIQQVLVALSGAPSFFHAPASIGPINISAGEIKNFVFPYSIDSNTPDGQFSITLTITPQGTPNCTPISPDTSWSSVVDFKIDTNPPKLALVDSRGAVPPGGATSGVGFAITVDDTLKPDGSAAVVVSGPGKIEIYRGATLIASNETDYPDVHTYTLAGLRLTGLQDGSYSVKAFDQAGNWSSVVDFIPFLTLSSVGHGFDLIFQSFTAKPVKFTTAQIIARTHETVLPGKLYTASYARGVALCHPLARLASAPLARSSVVVARPARGNGEKHLLCASRQSAGRSRSAIAARTPRNTASYARRLAHCPPLARLASARQARPDRTIAARADIRLRRTPAQGLPQDGRRYTAPVARVAVGGRTSGGQLPRSPDADFFFFRPARKEFKIIAVLAANTANRIIHCDGETKNTGENYYG